MQERQEKRYCYYCYELGHKCKRKQIFLLNGHESEVEATCEVKKEQQGKLSNLFPKDTTWKDAYIYITRKFLSKHFLLSLQI